jgi:hypothetical protein
MFDHLMEEVMKLEASVVGGSEILQYPELISQTHIQINPKIQAAMGNKLSSPAKNAVDGESVDYDMNYRSCFKSLPGSAILEKTFCGSIDTTDPAEYQDAGLTARMLKRAEIAPSALQQTKISRAKTIPCAVTFPNRKSALHSVIINSMIIVARRQWPRGLPSRKCPRVTSTNRSIPVLPCLSTHSFRKSRKIRNP